MRRASLIAALLLPLSASAHLMPAKQGTLNVVDNAVFQVLSVPVSAIRGVDDDGEGLLSLVELERHQEAIRTELDRRFTVTDGGRAGTTVRVDFGLSPEHDTETDRAGHLLVLKHIRFDAPPTELGLTCDLFGTDPAEQQLSITATRPGAGGKETEVAILTPREPEHRFFRTRLSAFLGYVRTGAEHVLFGTDHLLFLLTILIAGLGWRYWLGVVTGFTVAHGITLGAAMLGYVHLSPRIVEPLIALSIVVTAADNLFRPNVRLRERLVLVCGFGLLHGLGFAASMDAMGLDSAHRVISLVGFNAGVEVGQALFLVASLSAVVVVRRVLPHLELLWMRRAVSAAAVLVGSVWMVQRIVG